MTDFQVLTEGSGFGRVGAWLSNRWHSQYAISAHWEGVYAVSAHNRSCGPRDYDSLESSSSAWSGI
jgi:hypothetical protein